MSDEQAVIEQLAAAQSLSLDDFFTYAVTCTDPLDDADDFSAIRFSVMAELGGRAFERFVLDVAFRGAAGSPPNRVTTSSFLSFAGIERSPCQPLRLSNTSRKRCTPTPAHTAVLRDRVPDPKT